jgi:hypothetical protein
MPSQVQPTRSELKFEVTEAVACEIRRYLGATLRRDTHSVGNGELGYRVCSVYLDSPDSLLCSQTLDGKRNRYKLRVRIYDDHPAHPAFAEIKRRDGQVIKKQRATVSRMTANALLSGEPVAYAPLADGQSRDHGELRRDWVAFNEFCQLRDAIGATGSTYVSYQREAYVSPDGMEWRATFDRHLRAHPYRPGDAMTIPIDGVVAANDEVVVFELKFTNRFPSWMQELVRVFDLGAVSFPKYVNCLRSLGVEVNAATSRTVRSGVSPTQRAG